MIKNIVTLDNGDKYLLLLKNTLDNKTFFVGVKMILDKYTNEFKVFLEKQKDEEIFFEEINDEELLKTLVNDYILDNF